MNKGGMGVGSSSIMLVFAVLCLTVFSMISLMVARNNKALADAEAKLVAGYYAADAKAEEIIAHVLEFGGETPYDIVGLHDFWTVWDMESEMETIAFLCDLSAEKELYVRLTVEEGSALILGWQIMDIGTWEFDGSLDIWLDDFDDILMLGS